MARIVFDLDGTLIDSAPDIHAAVALMLKEEGCAPLDLGTVISFIGNGLPHLVKLVINATALDMQDHAELTQGVLDHYNAVSGTQSVLYPGVQQALTALAANGHVLGICTNKPEQPARDILKKLNLHPFDCVIGGDSLPKRKPDPAPLHAACDALGSGPVLYVGDSEVDAETAERAGIPFLLFTEGYRKTPIDQIQHTVAFSEFSDLSDRVDHCLRDV